MYLIDATKNLVSEKMTEFKAQVGNDKAEVTLLFEGNEEDMFEMTVESIRKECFENEAVENLIENNDSVLCLVSGEVCLKFTGFDYHAWVKPLRGEKYARLDNLFSGPRQRRKRGVEHDEKVRNEKARESLHREQLKRKADNATVYKVACAIKKDANLTDVERFEGTQKEVKDWVNKLFSRNYIRSFGRGVTVFCVNWKFEDDLNDINNWKTLNELTEEGIFTKKEK